jgi:hypothetical protein
MGAPHRRSFVLTSAACCLCLYTGAWAQTGVDLPPPAGGQLLTPELELQGAPDPDAVFLNFGAALSVAGDTLLVGMPRFNNDTGRVAVYTRDASRRWQRTGTIDPVGAQPGDQFGSEVALGRRFAIINGDMFRRVGNRWEHVPRASGLAVPGSTVFQFVSPEMWVFHADSRGRLRLVQRLRSPSGTADGFGSRIASSDDTLVIIASGDGDGQGAAYVYRRRGKLWHLMQKLIAADGQPGDEFGATVAVRDDVIAIGAPLADKMPAPERCSPFPDPISYGTVYVFVRRGNLWSEAQKVRSPNAECDQLFGLRLWLAKDRLIVDKPETARFFDDQSFYIYARHHGRFDPIARMGYDPQAFLTIEVSDHEMFIGNPTPFFVTSIGQVSVTPLRRMKPVE